MRKNIYPTIFIAVFLLILIQCGKGPEKASAGESKITIGMVADEWLFFLERAGTWAAQQMFLPLVYKDSRGEWEPALAERWEHSDDYKDWTFFLRKDVKFTFDLLMSPDVGDWRHPISSVEVIDDYSLIIRYKH